MYMWKRGYDHTAISEPPSPLYIQFRIVFSGTYKQVEDKWLESRDGKR